MFKDIKAMMMAMISDHVEKFSRWVVYCSPGSPNSFSKNVQILN